MGRSSLVRFLAALALGACGSFALAQADFARAFSGTASAEESLSESERTLAELRARKAGIEAELAASEPLRSAVRERLIQNGRALYRIRRSGLLPIAGGMRALLGHASRVRRLQRFVERDIAELDRLDGQVRALRAESDALGQRIEALALEITTRREARLRQALSQPAPVEPRRPPQAPDQGGDDRISYGLSVVGGVVAEPFVKQKGRLALPVSGAATIRAATRPESDGGGLEFSARSGASVRAAAAGRVAFAEAHGSYGNLVLVDHGQRYYTAYGGMAAVEVQVGDQVSKSARLGRAGSDPVYFEVRRGTKAQDPRSWLGL